MPVFLSEAWLDALDAAVRDSGPLPAELVDCDLALEVAVTPGRPAGEATRPDGAVVYTVVLERGRARVERGPTSCRPRVTMRTDRDTAARLHRGEASAQTALRDGRLSFGGDFACLPAAARALASLVSVADELRATTTYDAADTSGAEGARP